MAKPTNYIVGLDIGSNSCGWVVTDKQNNILRIKGKTAIGSRLFEEGKTAADRRGFRTTRRRLSRRHWRLKLLEEIFDPYISEIDETFFARMHESGYSPLDTRKSFKTILFKNKAREKAFYRQYPTIYHLRDTLMTDNQKHDLREVYLAIHHIVKYRGNFLNEGSVSSFNVGALNVAQTLKSLNDCFSELSMDNQIQLNQDNSDEITEILEDKKRYKSDKVKQIAKLLPIEVTDKAQNKINQKMAKEIANSWLGYQVKFDVLCQQEIEDKKTWHFKFDDPEVDTKLSLLFSQLDQGYQEIISLLKKQFDAITLNGIVPDGKTLSQSMVDKYQKHQQDLKLLKTLINEISDSEKAKRLQAAYDLYVTNRHMKLLVARETLSDKTGGVLSEDDFYKAIDQNLDDSKIANQIKREMALGRFMPKQRVNTNGVVPYQLHQLELDRIIEKQGQYYPFLKEKNPIKDEKHHKRAPYKLDELVVFRVPYYVGPLITTEDQKASSGKNFAWMVRQQKGTITPWNFDEKVDRVKSANEFIKRMTTKDTYLLGEDVLPAASLLYQEFTVWNELNLIRVNGAKLNQTQKQGIYEKLFKNNKTVTKKKLINFLNLSVVDIKGMADENKFNSSLSTYIDYKKIFGDKIDDLNLRNDFEKMIEWSTIFEDKGIFKKKLQEIEWLSEQQRDEVVNHRYQGWGRLSKRLLTGIHDTDGENILLRLRNTPDNLMQVINQPEFKAQIKAANQSVAKQNGMEDILTNAYTSPQNKKAIRQVMRVVNDIIKACDGNKPAQIAIEFARSPQDKRQLTKSRQAKLFAMYKELSGDLVDSALQHELDQVKDHKQMWKDAYYLYFIQLGRDAYTGERLNIDQIRNYQIDHILPQAFIKDDSLDNRVLVTQAANQRKGDHVPFKVFANNLVAHEKITVKAMWHKWLELGLISKRKYYQLLTDPESINKYQASGFIHRQLVETSQVIKLVATILQAALPETEIIEVKTASNSELRQEFNLYKSREVNDYHHAIDAYLTTICGNYLYTVYPKLRRYFVYGQFQKFSNPLQSSNEITNKIKRFNFLHALLGLKKKGEEVPDKIYVSGRQDIAFSRRKIISQLKTAYEFKYMLVSQEVSTRSDAMFNQTIYPREERDRTKARTLIPKKTGFSTKIYGGYSGNSDAYLAIVKIQKKTDSEYKVIGVPMRALSALKKAGSKETYNQLLYGVLKSSVMFDEKTGKAKKGINDFRIIRGKIPYRQYIIDGEKKFMLGSSTSLYNLKQLTLSTQSMKYILDYIDDTEYRKHNESHHAQEESECLISVYDEILEKINHYLPLFDINKFRQKLHSGKDKFIALNWQDKAIAIKKILNGVHANPVRESLKEIGLTTPFGFMQIPNGIILSDKAVLVYQSPTGLFERRVKLASL